MLIFSTVVTNSFIFKFWEIYDYDRLSYNAIRHGYKYIKGKRIFKMKKYFYGVVVFLSSTWLVNIKLKIKTKPIPISKIYT